MPDPKAHKKSEAKTLRGVILTSDSDSRDCMGGKGGGGGGGKGWGWMGGGEPQISRV